VSTIPELKALLLGEGTPFAIVKGALSLAAVKDRPDALPAAFVLAAKEVSQDNQRATGSVLQRSERDIMVVIVLEDLGDADGDATIDPLEDVKKWVRDRLIGFVPTDMQEPITHVDGEIVEARAGCAWFQDTFSAPVYIKEVS
jgi:hypothetical protein